MLSRFFFILGFFVIGGLAPTFAANEYFWPDNHEARNYKVKAHAIRGSVMMTLGTTITIGDHQYQEIVISPSPTGLPEQPKVIYLRADDKGLYSRFSNDSDSNETLDLALPVEIGKTWKTFDHLGNPSTRTIESISDCDLRGTLFKDCIRVAFQAPGGAAVAFFAPGQGEIVNSRKNGFVRRTLNMP